MPIPVPGRLAESVRQAVVQIRGDGGSLGSGVVIAPGRIITNAHVLSGSSMQIDNWEGATLPATILKQNRTRDLALLSVNALKADPLPLGDSKTLQPGMPVFAIGNPLGFVGAVSSGVIHSINLPRWVCADVRLAPGNSGGPLTNFNGQIIGINTMVISGGLALAVPSRAIQSFLKHDDSRNLGVVVRGVKFRHGFGLLVTGVIPDSAAERASLLIGDILTAANGLTFSHPDDLTDSIDNATNGLLELEFYRGGSTAVRRVAANLALKEARTAA